MKKIKNRKTIFPFRPATKGNQYCFPSCIGTVMASVEGNKDTSEDEKFIHKIDTICSFEKNKIWGRWALPYDAMFNLTKHGYKVVLIEGFDNERFAKQGSPFWKDYYGEFPGEISDLDKAAASLSKTLRINRKAIKRKKPTIEDIRYLLNKGCYIICSADSKALGHPTAGVNRNHAVLVYKLENEKLNIFDPYLRPAGTSISVSPGEFKNVVWQTVDNSGRTIRVRRHALGITPPDSLF